MKKLASFLGVVIAMTSFSEAAITYDGFAYTVGGNLVENPDWTGLNSGTPPVIVAGNLTVPGLPPPTGDKVSFAGGNFQEALGSLDLYNSGTVFFSVAFTLTSLPTVSTYSFGLATGNTNYGATVWLKADEGGTGFNVGLANRSNSTPNYDSTVLDLNTTYFIVGSYTFVDGATNDISNLWLNPDSATFGGAAPTATLSAVGGNDLSAISQFLLRGAAGSPAGEMDELRIGTSWDFVTPAVPEPGTVALIGLGVVVILFGVRRRRA